MAGTDNLIPTLWSAKILHNLDKAHVYGATCNTDYQGEITSFGQIVKIHNIGRVTVSDYAKYDALGQPDRVVSDERSLVIDQSKSFQFEIDDIDEAQQNPKIMGEATKESAYALNDVSDKFLAALYVDSTNVLASATSASPLALNPANAYDLFVDLKVALDKRNVPSEDRDAVISPDIEGLLLRDQRFVQQNRDGAEFRDNGMVGRASGFNLRVSNNVPVAGGAQVVQASYKGARTWAEQILTVEGYRSQRAFTNVLRGLHVYGAKLVRPEALAVAFVTV